MMPSRPIVAGELHRCKTHEANDDWPTMIEIVAYFGKEGRKGKRRSVEISGDQFFGRGGFNAPMDGGQIIAMIDRLRRS